MGNVISVWEIVVPFWILPSSFSGVMRSGPAKQILESGVWKHAEIREPTFCKSSWWFLSTHIRDMKAIWDHNNQSWLMISPLLRSYHVIVYHIPIEVRCYPLCVYRHAYTCNVWICAVYKVMYRRCVYSYLIYIL